MTIFAKIENITVTNLIVAEQEFVDTIAPEEGVQWIKVIDHDNVVIHLAGIGYTYDAELNVFIPPKPFNSWILNGSVWEAPNAMPLDGNHYIWDENTLNWIIEKE